MLLLQLTDDIVRTLVEATPSPGGGEIPNPPPAPPPGLTEPAKLLFAWLKWGGLVGGGFGLGIAGAIIAVTGKSKSQYGADAAVRIPWIIFGVSLLAVGASVVKIIYDAASTG